MRSVDRDSAMLTASSDGRAMAEAQDGLRLYKRIASVSVGAVGAILTVQV